MTAQARTITGDIYVCVTGDKHLFGAVAHGVNARKHSFEGDPRMLGFECRALFARHAEDYGMGQPDFSTPVMGAQQMDPMELAQVALRGRRPVYRPARQNLNFLEVHHVPNRASQAPTPFAKLKSFIDAEIGARDP